MHTNKVHRVAEELGEHEGWLRDLVSEMEIEDGVIWVYGVGEDGILAFTDFGIENLIELTRCTKTIQRCSSVISHNDQRGGPRRMLTLCLWQESLPCRLECDPNQELP